jgi:transglutaminase-like putative cysteine protease
MNWSWGWPASLTGSLLAGLTAWIALWSWAGFVARPSGYLVPTLGACLIVSVSGMLLRSGRVPRILVVVVQLALLVVWLNRTWAADLMFGGWFPTVSSMSEVGMRIEAGVRVSQAFAAPVPESAPEIFALLTIAGAGTAVLVDLLACGLRRVPLAGLPLLAVYSAPLSILNGGVPWWAFVACAVSFLFLLANDEAERLSSWGRQLSGGSQVFDSLGTNVNAAAVRSSARKIGFTATGLAVIVPIFIPTLSTSLFDRGGPGSGGDGDAVAISNPIADLKRDLTRGEDVELLRVQTRDDDPSYLRISVLDFFDGETWKPSGRDIPVEQRAEGRLPRPPGLDPSVPRTDVPYSVQVSSAFESRWLPTPYPVSTIEVDGDWRYDTSTLDIISAADGQTTQGLRYTLDAMQIQPDPAELVGASPVAEELFTTYTALPDSMPESVRTLAREVTDAQPSRFEKAVRLQDWFREDGGFTYSLDPAPGNGLDELENFLGTGENSRIGYCEQFAAAMSLMGRSIGIPSRVAVGFLRPERVAVNTYAYSSHDLHAWPEMYFEGTGWVRFEPTPQDRTGAVPGYTSQELPTDAPSDQAPSGAPNQQQNRINQQQAPTVPEASGGGGSGNGGSGLTVGMVASVLLLLLVTSPLLVRTLTRRRRWSRAGTPVEVAEAAWSELRDSALDLGIPWDDSVTLRTRARSLVGKFGEPDADPETDDGFSRSPVTGPSANPAATAALSRLVTFVERARYARAVEVETPHQDAAHDVALCVQAMRDGTTAKRRLRATWVPTSLVRTFSTELAQRKRTQLKAAALAEPGVDHAI